MKEVLCMTLLFVSLFSFTQTDYSNTKFGKDIEADLKKTEYEIDPSAEAIILFDKLSTEFRFSGEDLKRVDKKHIRIKVLKKSALERGDISLRYVANDRAQLINNIKASSYNFQGGKVEETKLSKKDIFKTDLDEYAKQIKFSIPNVKEGSVFELEFTKETKWGVSVPTRYFEFDIPVLHSEMVLKQPEWFQYQILNYVKTDFDEHVEEDITFSPGAGYGIVGAKLHRWVMKNKPALKEEPHTSSIDDFRDQIRFKHVATTIKGRPPKYFNRTWIDIVNELNDHDSFMGQVKGNKSILTSLPANIAVMQTQAEQAEAVHKYVREKVSWDDYYGIYTSRSLKSVFNAGSGDAAEMNLMMCKYLQHVGIDAKPLLISTRSNGAIEDLFPDVRSFSYPIVYAMIDGEPQLMNAVSSYAYNLPRLADLSEKGLIIQPSKVEWVELKKLVPPSTQLISVNAAINEAGDISGTVEMQERGYDAAFTRVALNEKDLSEIFEGSLPDDMASADFSNPKVENKSNKTEILKCTSEFEVEGYADVAGEFIYINPIVFQRIEENPFKVEKRLYPVDFNYPYNNTHLYTYKLPEGYTIQELPSPIKVMLPNKSGELMYVVQQNGDELKVVNKFTIKRTVFSPEEYELLKEFFDMALENHAGQIVLQKQ